MNTVQRKRLEKTFRHMKNGEWKEGMALAMILLEDAELTDDANYLAAVGHSGLGNLSIAHEFYQVAVKANKNIPFKYPLEEFPLEAQSILRQFGAIAISDIKEKKKLNKILIKCAYEGYYYGVKKAVEYGANVNCKDSDGKSALQIACDWEGSFKIAKFLLEHGADVNYRTDTTDTPLGYAVMYGNLDLVKLLINHGADVNKKGLYGRTPLHYAVLEGEWSQEYKEIIKILLKHGANPNEHNEGGDTPLLEAAWSEDFTPEMAQFLLENGFDLNVKNANGRITPLLRAAEYGKTEIVKVFFEKNKSSMSSEDIQEVVRKALEGNKKETVKYLLEDSGSMLTDDFLAREVLVWAADRGHLDILKYLAKKGLDFKKYLNEVNNAIREAAFRGYLDVIQYLVRHGGDVNGGRYGAAENPLMKAARYSYIELAEFLIENGADLEARDFRGNTPLMFAAWEGQLEMVRFLLQKGADVNAKNKLNWNALMQACLQGHYEIAKILIENGSEINVIEKEKGVTPLILAAYSGATGIIQLLLDAGADKTIKNKEGKTAYDIAIDQYNLDIADLLK